MRLLDLFCGAGGAAMGYHLAGFDEIVGVDVKPQPRYPFTFIQADAMTYPLDGFDAIHASPPCQAYVTFAKQAKTTANHPDLVAKTRDRLRASGTAYVIENVPGAPLEAPILLCGTMFPGLRVIRHRHFETSFFTLNPLIHRDHPPVFIDPVHGNRVKPGLSEYEAFVCVVGGYRGEHPAAEDAMGIDWMNRRELAQAIPPAYTEFIGWQLLNALEKVA
ncbi:MAG: DNA cytosine methyltransferase [Patescibacteria group bacterium]|nr:DNA cytosine methyltransferase [Patescibacteria group bacterium]